MHTLLASLTLLVLPFLVAGCGQAGDPRAAAGPAVPAPPRCDVVTGRGCHGPIVGSIYADSSRVSCVRGTTDLGVHRAYASGTEIRARLCAVPGFRSSSAESTPGSAYYVHGANGNVIVNARVARGVLGLHSAARRSGLTLRASSSFRTMRHQQRLCSADPGCRRGDYTFVARPGFSNHQLGVAIDFTGTDEKGAASCGRGRATDPGSPVWRYLRRHAERFGFRQYAPESWHWDAMVGNDRCRERT